jgi:hypothetical protein
MDSQKYIKAGHTWNDPWEGKDVTCEYQFRRPNRSDISRFNREISKSPDVAQNNLLLGMVHSEDAEKLKADIEVYPALLPTLAAWALKSSGLTDLGN